VIPLFDNCVWIDDLLVNTNTPSLYCISLANSGKITNDIEIGTAYIIRFRMMTEFFRE